MTTHELPDDLMQEVLAKASLRAAKAKVLVAMHAKRAAADAFNQEVLKLQANCPHNHVLYEWSGGEELAVCVDCRLYYYSHMLRVDERMKHPLYGISLADNGQKGRTVVDSNIDAICRLRDWVDYE